MNTNSHCAELKTNKQKVAASLRDLMAGTEDLLRSTASYTGEEIDGARRRVRNQLESIRGSTGDWERMAAERYRRVSDATDGYVHENAWKSIGLAALVGVLLGACMAASNSRR